MRRIQTALHARRAGQDDGMALVAVLGVMTVLTAFLLVILASALQNLNPTRADQDAKTAMAAAEAGIEEYLSRLNANDSYWTTGNTDTANPAFTTAGSPVPGATGSTARFRYRLVSDPSEISKSGKIRLEVTGTSQAHDSGGTVERTLTATLQPAGFLDFVYMTDLEDFDPIFYKNDINWLYATYDGFSYAKTSNGSTGGTSTAGRYRYLTTPARIEADCSKHYYDGRLTGQYTATSVVSGSADAVMIYDTQSGTSVPLTTSTQLNRTVAAYKDCTEIQWVSGDVINGPFHSNDAIQINGGVLFTRPRTESSWPTCQANPTANCWWGSGTPLGATNSPPGYKPKYAPPIQVPPGNEEFRRYVEPRTDDPTAPPGKGCLYTGATRIIFTDDKMKVLSPNTTNAPDRCLTVSARSQEQTKDIPPVIYVVRSTGTCSGVGYPVANEDVTKGYTTDYTCTRGSVMVKGTFKGQTTVAAQDDVVITGDLLRKDRNNGSTDVLGLIGGNNVWVHHPVNSSGANLYSSANSVHNIDAAILSLQHSFIVQNYNLGSGLSTASDTTTKLNVYGAIAQRFRGPVGLSGGSSGYLKNYVYDDRLTFLQPPYFLKPSSSPWITKKITDG